ncbi:MAG TPA: PAS domain-containing protein, partial [Deinococcales bacterium]|nr:PAS domain-containing protein [Deinococcales bacterium]
MQAEDNAQQQAEGSRLDALPQIVVIYDGAGRCSQVNARWSELTGLPSEVALESGFQAALHPDDQERVASALERAIAA